MDGLDLNHAGLIIQLQLGESSHHHIGWANSFHCNAMYKAIPGLNTNGPG